MKISGLILYDFDNVEEVNMAGQLYASRHIGMAKVDATRNVLHEFASYYSYQSFYSAFNSSCYSADIMICGFDNMAARKIYFNRWLHHVEGKQDKEKCLFIDGRLNAEEFQVLAIQGNDERAIKEYKEKWLFNDSEVEEAVCSYKQTTFMANMIASVMVNIFVNFVANECNPIFPRDVPFFTSYSADTMFTKTIL